ncbi:PAS domain-containing protein, partial [Escherichia coli]|nr:PAS domain-containing protein [Escherichia coli]
GYLVTDLAGVIREANRAAAALLDRPTRYLVGKPVRVFVRPAHRPRLDRLLAQVAAEGTAREEVELAGRDPAVTIALHVNAARP